MSPSHLCSLSSSLTTTTAGADVSHFLNSRAPSDTYFASPDPLDFHPYVCLAILTTCKESLEELDQSEVRSMLLSLPVMDVDRVCAFSLSRDGVEEVNGIS